jgi:glyceraldehyde-3-phosphate dehydrogenase/erythrose-4-phosphate dehydrogenase
MYGGGVNLENLEELHYGLSSHSDFSGYLVGEATTRPAEFVEMARRLDALVEGAGPSRNNRTEMVQRAALRVVENTARTVPVRVGAISPIGTTRVAIVGFGEIGVATAIASALDPGRAVDVVQIFNQYLSPKDAHARVVQSRFIDPEDSSYFREDGKSFLKIHGQISELTPHSSLDDAARQLRDVDVVVFTVGDYTKDQAALSPFLRPGGGAKVVLVTCATPVADYSIVPGFNHHLVNLRQHRILALGSCTGNCAVPLLSVIEELFGEGSIRGAYAVAPHSKTNTQEVGNKGADPKRETILGNLIPTSTGLGKLLQQPGFFGAISESTEAVSVRTPTEDVSLLCMSVDVEGGDNVTTADVASAFRDASTSPRWRGIIGLEEAHGTKMFWKDRRACIVYEPYVRLIPKFLKDGARAPLSTVTVVAAYANVFGYSSQVVRGVASLKLGRNAVEHGTNRAEQESLVVCA